MSPPDEVLVSYPLTEVLDRIDHRLERIEHRLSDLEGWKAKVIGLALGAGAASGSGVFALLRAVVG